MYRAQYCHRSVATIALLIGAPTVLAQPSSPSFHRIGVPPGFEHSEALAVSNTGVVVGEAYRFEPWFKQGFRWTASAGLELLPIPAGQKTAGAVSISDDGRSVLGRALGFGRGLGVIWRDGEMTFLQGLLHETAVMSGDGQFAVGSIRDGSGVRRGMRWDSAGVQVPMSDFPVEPGEDSDIRARSTNLDGSVVAGIGWMEPGPWYHAFRWTADGGYQMLGVIPGFPETHANDLSEDGLVIAGHGSTGFHQAAFRWTGQTGFLLLGALPGGTSASVATGISGDGEVIVGYSGVIHPFIWDELNGMRNLREVATDLLGHDPTVAFTKMRPMGISADGRMIVGHGETEFEKLEGWVLILPDSACYADCDASGSLDFFDFLCFQNLFAAGASEADCDASGSLDLFDFLCFQNAFAAGCP